MKKELAVFLAVFALAVMASPVFGEEPTREEKFKHADRNKDGRVDKKEIHMEKKWEHRHEAKEKRFWWKHKRAKVNTPIEAKYDTNGNGWLEPDEVKEMLKDRYALIKTHGKAKVDTEIEKGYDTNDDGILDATEAEAMNEDIQ